MQPLKFAIFGTGFWASYQLPGWQELEGVTCVAAYNRTKSKAEAVAAKFGIPNVYNDPAQLLENEELDFIDICTDVATHLPFAEMAAAKGLDVVCQKPMANSLEDARKLVNLCRQQRVKLFINENFRWQAPVRRLKAAMDSGVIGEVFKARISFLSAFPVYDNQPFLTELDHFILTDIGSHVLDIARFICGDAKTLYCLTKTVNPRIRGEDVANCFMEMKNGIHCFTEMSYASLLEKEAFPQTLILLEGTRGSIRLDHDFVLKITTESGTEEMLVKPRLYDWIDPEYAVVHSSIVDAQRDILNGLNGGAAETTGADNLKTTELVWKSYESAATGTVIHL